MAIKNDTEFLVRKELRNRRDRPAKGDDTCWCALCEMDILALALNRLPPRYCHEKNFGCTASEGLDQRVRQAVALAIHKVSRRPKHRPGRPPSRSDEIRMENFAQTIGGALVGTVLAPGSPACTCELCRADTLALALNSYPPKYGVSYGGRESYQANYADFIRHEVAQQLTRAMAVVRERPHH